MTRYYLNYVNSTWNKTIIITGDTNVHYLKPSVALKRYKEVIETYKLKQHITIPARKGTKIIDHIITNLQENKLITTNLLPCPTVSDHDAPYSHAHYAPIASLELNFKPEQSTDRT